MKTKKQEMSKVMFFKNHLPVLNLFVLLMTLKQELLLQQENI